MKCKECGSSYVGIDNRHCLCEDQDHDNCLDHECICMESEWENPTFKEWSESK